MIIAGHARSGTTALTYLVNSHLDIAVLHESRLVNLLRSLDEIDAASSFKKNVLEVIEKNEITGDAIASNERESADVVLSDDVGSLDKYDQFSVSRDSDLHESDPDAPIIMSPSIDEELKFSIVKQIIQHSWAHKRNVKIIGDKITNLFSQPDVLDYYLASYNIKILVILRNPIDTVNSSYARLLKAQLGKDVWPWTSFDSIVNGYIQEIQATRSFYERHADQCLLLKYEDILNDFETVSDSIAVFLGVENSFKNNFKSLPPELRHYALDAHLLEHCQDLFHHMLGLWATATPAELLHNWRFGCVLRPDIQVLFSTQTEFAKYVADPTTAYESWGFWTLADQTCLTFRVEPATEYAYLVLEFSLADHFILCDKVFSMILCNGKKVCDLTISRGDNCFYVTIPRENVIDSHVLLRFVIFNYNTLDGVGIPNDRRPLGIGITSMLLRLV